nr:MAG TPA: hypothetical protein [Caudoviricetes sp.]
MQSRQQCCANLYYLLDHFLELCSKATILNLL